MNTGGMRRLSGHSGSAAPLSRRASWAIAMASSCPDVLQFARLGAVGRRGPPLRKLAQQAVHKRAIEQRHCLPWANEQTQS